MKINAAVLAALAIMSRSPDSKPASCCASSSWNVAASAAGIGFRSNICSANDRAGDAIAGAADRLASGLPVYDSRQCANGDVLAPPIVSRPSLEEFVQSPAFRTAPGDRNVPRTGCTSQGAYPGSGTSFPQLRAEP